MEAVFMRFCDFINKLKPHFACDSQEAFASDIFSALCGGNSPVGLTGDDATYRKLLFSGNNKKYQGLSNPIKTHVLANKNTDTFIAYCNGHVSVKEYEALCNGFELDSSTPRPFLFEALYEQFSEFAKSKDDAAAEVVYSKVSEYLQVREAPNVIITLPFHKGDDFSSPKPSDRTEPFYKKFTVMLTLRNTGTVKWIGRYLKDINSKQKGVRGVIDKVDIPDIVPGKETTVKIELNAGQYEMTSDSVWEIYDSDDNLCFPNKQGEIKITISVINPNRKEKTEGK